MKKRSFLLPLIALLSYQHLYAQAPQTEPEKWVAQPVISKLDGKYAKEAAVVLFDKRKIEYVDDSRDKQSEYYTLHKIVHINDDRGIEYYNKIYLGISENADIVEIKGRTVLPGGKVIMLDKNNIKDIKEQDGNVYKIFAMEGLEKGCEIEYYYTFKKNVSYFGREVMQGNMPVLKSVFQISAPDRLRFDIKSYNFDVTPSDTVINNRRFMQCTLAGTSGIDEEKYANYWANLRRIEFKLSYNDLISKGERLFTWNEMAKRIFAAYTEATVKDNRKIEELVQENGWDKLSSEVSKIVAVESYVKKKFAYDENLNSEEGNTVSGVIQNKVGGTIGMMRLYSAVFQNLAINFQFVLTGDRGKFIIDRSFENWNNCDNPLFYFPAEGKYLAPTRPDYRYPWIFPNWGGTNGLFCKRTTLGSYSTAIAEIRTVALEDYTQSADNIEAKLELNAGLDSLTIDDRQIFTGYAATGFRDAFNYSNEEQKTNIIKELAKSFASTDHILFSEVLNQEFDKANANLPLTLHTKTRSTELVERAGNKLLIKMGMAIGPQVEMYQEKPRQEPVDIDFGHVEDRKIDFIIPDGYTVSNLNDLKMDQTYKDNGELTMGFVSDYELKGNVLSIHIVEQYRNIFYPLSQFEQFRKIINASSDFNKVVLVLEKKS